MYIGINHSILIVDGNNLEKMKQRFISKVYSIVWLQLFLTSIFIGICNYSGLVKNFMVGPFGSGIMVVFSWLFIFLSLSLFSCYDSIKGTPNNWIFWSMYTGIMIYLIGYISVFTSTEVLLLSGVLTLGIFSGLTIYSIQTKVDYTRKGDILLILLLGLFLMGILSVFLPLIRYVYSLIGAVIFSFYIVYDTQLIIKGGNNRNIYDIGDYMIVSLNLYLDIVNLFLYLIQIVNGR